MVVYSHMCTLLVVFSVNPHPIYYPKQPADVIYFNGSTIEFTCDVSCEQDCQTLVYYKSGSKSFYLVHDNLYGVPLKYQLDDSEYPPKFTLKFTGANADNSGSYQCLTRAWPMNNVWPKFYIVSKEIKFQMAGMRTYVHNFSCTMCLMIIDYECTYSYNYIAVVVKI